MKDAAITASPMMRMSSIDEIAGLPSGLASKVLGPIPQRRMGPTTLPLILGALGLRIGLIEDAEALRRISSRLVPRHEKSAHGRVPRLETISAELREELMAAARAELERKAETRRRRSPRNGRNGRRAA